MVGNGRFGAETWELLCPGHSFFGPKTGLSYFYLMGSCFLGVFMGFSGWVATTWERLGAAPFFFQNLGVPFFFEWE